jgi:hypothetical protein
VAIKLGKAYLDGASGLKADYCLGLRAWGLILYASLPASLAALGVGKLEHLELASSDPWVVVAAILVTAVPVLVILLLIAQRLESWYLAEDFAWLRCSSVTVVVVLTAGVLTGAAQLFTDGPPVRGQILHAIANAFLVGALTLSLSSALFLTAIQSDSGLPLMPTRSFTSDIEQVRATLEEIASSGYWKKDPAAIEELGKHIEQAKETLDSLTRQVRPGSPRAKLYGRLIADLDALDYARLQAADAPTRFNDFLDPNQTYLSDEDLPHRSGVDRLRQAIGVT